MSPEPMSIQIANFPAPLKKFLTIWLFCLISGVIVGLYFVSTANQWSVKGTVENLNGSEVLDEMDIPDKYPKPIKELLITTHSHVISFSLIFGSLGLLFFFNSTVQSPFWKSFWMTEPLLSTITTFGSMWLIRFVHPSFVWLLILSSSLMYLSFYVMSGICLRELLGKKG